MYNQTTKDLIISKVFKLLIKKGYDGVSITDIQKETGLSRGLLYHYFGGKNELFVEVTTKYFLEIFSIELEKTKNYTVKEMIDFYGDKYNDILNNAFDQFTKQDDITIIDYDFLFYRVMQESEIFLKKYLQSREDEICAWQTVLDNSKHRGVIKKEINTAVCAKHFVFLIDGIWMSTMNSKSLNTMIDTLHSTLNEYYDLIVDTKPL